MSISISIAIHISTTDTPMTPQIDKFTGNRYIYLFHRLTFYHKSTNMYCVKWGKWKKLFLCRMDFKRGILPESSCESSHRLNPIPWCPCRHP
jgi:hypothetical protein